MKEFNLTWEQRAVVEATEDKIVVMASPASGKTQTAAARVKYMIDNGYSPFDIVILSFTVAGAAAIAERVKDTGVYVGTLHSYCCSFLAKAGIKVHSILEREAFDEIFGLVKANTEIIPQGKYIVLDEAQDTSEEQYDLLFNYLKPSGFMLMGDPRQTIYTFANANQINVLPDIAARKDIKVYDLNNNFRNSINVLSKARKVLAKTQFFDESELMRDERGVVSEGEFSFPTLRDLVMLNFEDKSEIFVLCRTNAMVNSCSDYLTKCSIPNSNFSSLGSSDKEFENEMKKDTVKVLTTFKAKGLEAKIVIACEPTYYNEAERLLTYVAFTRAKDKLYILDKPKKKKQNKKWF